MPSSPDHQQKGETTMLVKAKWNVKGLDGWHFTGEVFQTEEDYGDAVEVLDVPKAPPAKEPVKAEAPVPEEPKAEKPKAVSRRKKTNA